MSNRVGAILAGGRGSRMGKLGRSYPKALLPVANRPVISYQFELMDQLGIRHVFVVVGHKAESLVAAVEEMDLGELEITFVDQGHSKGSAHALGCLRECINQPFVLLLGDYMFECDQPERMLACLEGGGGGAIAVKRETNSQLVSQACSVEVTEDNRVMQIVEKPVWPKSSLKGCGFYAFRPEIFDAVARTPRTALRDEYELTVAIEYYIKLGIPFFAEEIVRWDANLTQPQDLLDCNLHSLSQLGASNLVAETASIRGRLSLERSVVGSGASLSGKGCLRDVVVFPDVASKNQGDISRAIITREGSISVDRKLI